MIKRTLRDDRYARARELVSYLIVVIIGLTARARVPMDIVWGSGHDAQLQVTLARNLLNGRWLGNESIAEHWVGTQWNLVLAKGPGYPIFLTMVRPTGLNPVIAAYLLYLLGAFLAARAIERWTNFRFGLASFTVLTFSPALFGGEFSRVYRNGLVAGLALLALGIILHLGSTWTIHHEDTRQQIRLALLALVFGLTLGFLWITRIDTYWVLVTTGLCVLFIVVPMIRVFHFAKLLRLFAPLILAVVAGAAVLPLGVATMNQNHYGVFAVEDFSTGPLAETSKILSSIKTESTHTLVHVNKEQREIAYSVSPTFAQISTQLEDPESPWKSAACNAIAVCDESASWFPWELRDAPVRTGLVQNLRQLHDFFAKVEAELSGACSRGDIVCTDGEYAIQVRGLNKVDKSQLLNEWVRSVGLYLRGTGLPNFFNMAPLGIPELDELWTSTVNGIDLESPSKAVDQFAVLLTSLYSILIPVGLFRVALLATQRRRMDHRLLAFGFACFIGALLNAFIVSWFSTEIGVTTEANSGYLFASQSFVLLGVLLLNGAATEPELG